MSWREAMLGVMRGEPSPGLLFVPRLDIWFNANRRRGTLPASLEGMGLADVARHLGVGLHSVVPDFARTGDTSDLHHRALGFYNHPDFPFRADFSAVDYRVITEPEVLTTVYSTSRGELATRIRFGPEFLDSGMSIPDILQPAITGAEDYPRLAEVLAKVRIVARPDGYARYRARVGDQGVAVAYLSLAASPMHHVMRDLRRLEPFFFDMADDPGPVRDIAEVLSGTYDALLEAAVASSAEVVLLGANYDDAVTYPPFFEEHILPWLARAGEKLHAAGKLLLTHTDGENEHLLPLYGRCRFDIADSVCPAPMTRLPLRAYREAFGGTVTTWGGVPSVAVLRSSFSDGDFRAYVDALVEQARPFDRFILSVADTLPPDADFDRVLYLRDVAARVRAG